MSMLVPVSSVRARITAATLADHVADFSGLIFMVDHARCKAGQLFAALPTASFMMPRIMQTAFLGLRQGGLHDSLVMPLILMSIWQCGYAVFVPP